MKIIFFDLDNTLWDENMIIPESAMRTVEELHKNGHLTFLCTGRARSNLQSAQLPTLPLDGIMAACGNHIEMKGRILKEDLLSDEVVRHTIEVMKKYHMPAVVEGPEYHWVDEYGFESDPYVDYLWKTLKDYCRPLRGYEPGMRVSKFSSLILPETDWPAIKRELTGELAFLEHPYNVVELIPFGTSKATGINWLCNYLGISAEDTYALGDSPNDLEMLEAVGHGIAMGNALPEVKEKAEYITTDIHEDGVRNAMKHYGLIESA